MVYTLIFLLPGLLGTSLFRLLAESRRLGAFDLLTFSLMLTLGGNVLADAAFGTSPLPDVRMGDDRVLIFSYANYTLRGFCAAALVSLTLSLLCVWMG